MAARSPRRDAVPSSSRSPCWRAAAWACATPAAKVRQAEDLEAVPSALAPGEPSLGLRNISCAILSGNSAKKPGYFRCRPLASMTPPCPPIAPCHPGMSCWLHSKPLNRSWNKITCSTSATAPWLYSVVPVVMQRMATQPQAPRGPHSEAEPAVRTWQVYFVPVPLLRPGRPDHRVPGQPQPPGTDRGPGAPGGTPTLYHRNAT